MLRKQAMTELEFYDGGAYAELPFAQYPGGMGGSELPAHVLRAAQRARMQPPPCADNATVVSPAVPASSAGTALVVSARPSSSHALATVHNHDAAPAESPAATDERMARTRAAIQDAVKAQQRVVDDDDAFGARSVRRATPKANTAALAIVIPAETHALVPGAADPAPVLRSPTRVKKSSVAPELTTGANAEAGGKGVTVPFAVSSWRNKKKLIIPVEQRLAQQRDTRADAGGDSGGGAGIGDKVMALAVAMQAASQEVAQALQAKERALAEEEERRQAALEAAEAERAKELLAQTAARLASEAQRYETREQRLERVRLERELRERERAERRRQQLLQKAAARLNVSVEALEADSELLRTVEQTAIVGPASAPSTRSGGGATTDAKASLTSTSTLSASVAAVGDDAANKNDDDDDDGDGDGTRRRRARVTGGVFASAVVSNEGIRREMEALAQLEASSGGDSDTRSGAATRVAATKLDDGIHWSPEDTAHDSSSSTRNARVAADDDVDDDDDDDEDEVSLHRLMKRARTQL